MLYATKDSGQSIGEVISSVAGVCEIDSVEIKLTQDDMTIRVVLAGKKKNTASEVGKSVKKRTKHPHKSVTSKGTSNNPTKITYDGLTLTVKEWAEKLNFSEQGIRYRLEKYGSPYGMKGPTNKDKIIAGMS